MRRQGIIQSSKSDDRSSYSTYSIQVITKVMIHPTKKRDEEQNEQ